VAPLQDDLAIPWWLRMRKLLPKSIRKDFDSFFFLLGWSLWKERNDRTFRGTSTTAQQRALLIKEEADAWCRAGFTKLGALFLGG